MGAMGDMFSYCSRGVMSAQSSLSQKRGGLSSSRMLAIEDVVAVKIKTVSYYVIIPSTALFFLFSVLLTRNRNEKTANISEEILNRI